MVQRVVAVAEMQSQSKGAYRGVPLEEMSREELEAAVVELGDAYGRLLRERAAQ